MRKWTKTQNLKLICAQSFAGIILMISGMAIDNVALICTGVLITVMCGLVIIIIEEMDRVSTK